MVEKAESSTGNHFTFIVNEKLWQDLQISLASFLGNFKVIESFMWSKQANDYVKVGGTFQSYEFGGNVISFKVDRSFSIEYGNNKGYGLCLDLTADKTSAQPPIAMFTLKGADFITNKFPGVGGLDGISSGVVSSPVAGSKLKFIGVLISDD